MKRNMKLVKLLPMLQADVSAAVVKLVQAAGRKVDEIEVRRVGGDAVKRAPSQAELATLKDGEMAVIQYVSTRDLDRDHEILDPAGCCLTEFLKAPQVLEAHDYSKPPIGKDEWIKADAVGVMAKTIYAPTERGKEFFALRKGGFLNTSSVGFIPLDWTGPSCKDWGKMCMKYLSEWPEFSAVKDTCKRVITKWMLLEHSDVSVPANINALTVAVAKGLKISPAMMEELGIEKTKENEFLPDDYRKKLEEVTRHEVTEADIQKWLKDHNLKAEPIIKREVKEFRVVKLVKAHTPIIRLALADMVKENVKFVLDMKTGKV